MAKQRYQSKPRVAKSVASLKKSGPLRLSQCMIVKNEEANIERALSWGKDIVCEQIVVDTGSTDRTVEIAESMGAKIYHFEWIDDFSAAKNFAIAQASGDWIAFLDADEYFTDEDAKKVKLILEGIDSTPNMRAKAQILRCNIVNLEDSGKPFSVYIQQRIYQNIPENRYEGRIHEMLVNSNVNIAITDEINIMHTGYSNSSYASKQTSIRNVAMLRKELLVHPEDDNLKGYLADSLLIDRTEENVKEAVELFKQVFESEQPILTMIRRNMFNLLIAYALQIGDNDAAANLCDMAVKEFPENPDYYYNYGNAYFNSEDYRNAWDKYVKADDILANSTEAIESSLLERSIHLFAQMAQTAFVLKDWTNTVKYGTLTLKEDHYQAGILVPLIMVLRTQGSTASDSDMIRFLEQLYDLNSIKDKLFLSRCAKDAKDGALLQIIFESITDEEQAWLAEGTGLTLKLK